MPRKLPGVGGLIHHALTGFLSPEQVQQALELWEREFGHSPGFVFLVYSRRLDEVLGLGAKRSEVTKRLRENMFAKLEDLGPDPGLPEMQTLPGTAALAARPASGPGAPTVWTGARETSSCSTPSSAALSSGWRPATGTSSSSCARTYRNCSKKLRFRPGAKREIGAWCRNSAQFVTPKFRTGLERAEMAHVVHNLYVWLCEIEGPVAADRILGAAIREAEALPEATSCPPHEFL